MTAPVLVLAVLSVIGGWIQFAAFWTPLTTWLDPVAPPLAEASDTQEAVSRSSPSCSARQDRRRLADLRHAHAWRPRLAFAQRLLEHKFYFDEAYDFAFYRPAVFLATGLARWIEGPLIGGSVRELAKGFGLSRPRHEPAADWARPHLRRLRSLRASPSSRSSSWRCA